MSINSIALKSIILKTTAFVSIATQLGGQSYMEKSLSNNVIQVSAPITTDTSGKMGIVAQSSVLRVICQSTKMGGTGFLHKSGVVITAAHVVLNCDNNDLLLVTSSGDQIGVNSVSKDENKDLAILWPEKPLQGPTLQISSSSSIEVGSQITTWGFPSGYNSLSPLLTVGYLSGIDQIKTPSGVLINRWVVNAAFNSGNSGGPVLDLEDGSVIGVVSSKLAPIPPYIESALEALSKQTSGFVYTKTLPDGSTEQISEGKIIAEVLLYLRSQTQLVLGHAVTSIDLISFLNDNKIDP
ncbi:MAG: trypsin-like peptidase domain-containing protein [Candidatus Marinimicrobia bacterium]|nr:trypsin-like peptidase domain-containing protein [Candidatus Neomarinimicrobiota bacterium]